jgi:hypothetical protein
VPRKEGQALSTVPTARAGLWWEGHVFIVFQMGTLAHSPSLACLPRDNDPVSRTLESYPRRYKRVYAQVHTHVTRNYAHVLCTLVLELYAFC